MGLQIRVRHALGERVIELTDRTADNPVVVGRSAAAEVQVPSVTVAARHCALFVHDGHWVVQDLGAGAGTFVNGQAVDEPALLQVGDVVSVGGGAAAPTIEIDPAAAAQGRTGYAGTGLPHLQQAGPAYGAAAGYAPAGGYGAGGYRAGGGYAVPSAGGRAQAHAARTSYAAQAADEQPADEFSELASAASATATTYRRRKKKSGVGAQVAVVAAAAVLIGGVAVVVVMNKKEAAKPAPAPVAAKPAEPEKVSQPLPTGPGHLFPEMMANGSPTTPTPRTPPAAGRTPPAASPPVASPPVASPTVASPTTPPANPPAAAPPQDGMDVRRPPADAPKTQPAASGGADDGMDVRKPAPTAAPAPKDAENMDPAAANQWKSMQELADLPGKESFAVLRFEDFRRLNPGKYDAQLDAFIDKKMDRIWWERIDQLFKKIKRLDADIDKIKAEKDDVNDPAEKQKMLDSIVRMTKEKEAASKTLHGTMGYAEGKAPDLDNEAALAEASGKRNKQLFSNWKQITSTYIKANQGRLLWTNDQ